MLKFFNEFLLYNKWALNAIKVLQKPNSVLYSETKLYEKLLSIKFFRFWDLNLFPSIDYWLDTENFLMNFPKAWHPSHFERSLVTTPEEQRYSIEFLEPIEIVALKACHQLMEFYLYLPVFLTDFFKYYPYFTYYTKTPLPFDEIELEYLDFWITALPVFEDILGHLLTNDTPFTESGYYETVFSSLVLKAPILENINFSEHLKEYYFGEGCIPEFKTVINLYLDIRPELKNRCLVSLAQDKQLNDQISDDLAVYFISHFLIKGLSKYTLCFLVANLNLSNKNPAKRSRDKATENWNSDSQEEKDSFIDRTRSSSVSVPLHWPRLKLPPTLPWPHFPIDTK